MSLFSECCDVDVVHYYYNYNIRHHKQKPQIQQIQQFNYYKQTDNNGICVFVVCVVIVQFKFNWRSGSIFALWCCCFCARLCLWWWKHGGNNRDVDIEA